MKLTKMINKHKMMKIIKLKELHHLLDLPEMETKKIKDVIEVEAESKKKDNIAMIIEMPILKPLQKYISQV
jgi:hypothetical protein